MNEQVKNLIEEKIKGFREIELEKKKKHLIKLGLVDKKKLEIIKYSYFFEGAKYDFKEGIYFKEVPVTLELSDEEYAELCKYYPEEVNIEKDQYTEQKMRKDISSIKSWVMFWSILSIVIAIIVVIFLISNM